MNSALDRTIAPEVKTFGRMTLPAERIVATPSGMRVHVLNDPSCLLTRVCVIAKGGKDEAVSQALAATVAKMLPEGSVTYDVERTADIIDFNGANISGRCSEHHTRIELTALSHSIADMLPVLFALVTEPDFPAARLEAAKAFLSAQCAYDNSRVDSIAAKAAFKLIAGASHPQSRYAAPDDFADISRTDVCNSIRAAFCRGGVEIFVSGGADDRLVEDICRIADTLPERRGVDTVLIPYEAEQPQTVFVPHPGAEQCAVQAMIPAISRSHPDYLPLRLAVTALGGFFGSRLMQNIREDKGLTYGISASLCGIREGSYIDISAQCAPQYTSQLLDELRSELLRMASQPLSDDELLRMRLYEQTRLAAILDNAIATGDHYLTAFTIGMPENYFELQERITATITAEQIAEVSTRYLRPEHLRIVIAGVEN